MPKNLVVCCDGTWNEPDEARGGASSPTNVAKLALAIAVGQDEHAQVPQTLYYEPGVGTAADERITGGAFGYGLSRNIRNCYRFLADNYEDGDNLFLFGFSRGAYTARSLAGLVRNSGILHKQHADRVDEAFALYRDRTSRTHPNALAAQIFRRMYSHDEDDIHFIGVWDTVGALGIPRELPGWEALSKVFTGWEQLWGFHDTQLSSHVRYAYHALAIDEQREAFRPTLWTGPAPAPDKQTVEQVWFSGVHSEVGGGSQHPQLSDIALLWMVDRAKDAGLQVAPGQLEKAPASDQATGVDPNYAADIADSRTGLWAVLHPYHRLAELPIGDAPGQSMASSAVRRYDEQVKGYSPRGMREYIGALTETKVDEGVPRPA